MTRSVPARFEAEKCPSCDDAGGIGGTGQAQPQHDSGPSPMVWSFREPCSGEAFASAFGTVRVCLDCGALVAGGPTRCVRCVRAEETQAQAQGAGEALIEMQRVVADVCATETKLRAECDRLAAELDANLDHIDKLRCELAQERMSRAQERDAARAELAKATSQVQRQTTQLSVQAGMLDERQQQVFAAEADRVAAQSVLAAVQKKLAEARQEAVSAKRDALALEDRCLELQRMLDAANASPGSSPSRESETSE